MAGGFRKWLFGYSQAEVDAHVSELQKNLDGQREAFEAQQKELQELREKTQRQQEAIDKYREQERYITGALVQAQSHAVQLQQQADEDYEKVIARLQQQTAQWQQQIDANRGKLLELDRAVVELLQGFRTQLLDTIRLSGEPVQSVLKAGADEPARVPDKSLPEPQIPPGGVKPAVDEDMQKLYWKLHKLQSGEGLPDQVIVSDEEDALRQLDGEPAPPEESGESAAISQDEKKRLEALCRELGLLEGTDDESADTDDENAGENSENESG
ncbi:MAG: DivIVA domain-containing protein [Christensenellales bacterium]|jgi:hypothetical protein